MITEDSLAGEGTVEMTYDIAMQTIELLRSELAAERAGAGSRAQLTQLHDRVRELELEVETLKVNVSLRAKRIRLLTKPGAVTALNRGTVK